MHKITNDPMNFLAFGHRNGVGKSTLARELEYDWGYQVFETSAAIYRAAEAILGAQVTSDIMFKEKILSNGQRGRDLLVAIGNLGREYGGPTNWLLECGAIKAVLTGRKVVVVGLRSKEEVELINHLGGYPVRIDGDGSEYACMMDDADNADWRWIIRNRKTVPAAMTIDLFMQAHGKGRSV